MAMNAGNLSAAIKAQLIATLASYLGLNDDDNDDEGLGGFGQIDYLQKLSDAIADQVVAHITRRGAGGLVFMRELKKPENGC